MKVFWMILSLLHLSSSEDYYKLLGVARNADEKAIKKAFKSLSLAHHPDRADGDSQDYFMKLSHAYEALTDPAKREIYDTYGEDGLKGGKNYNLDPIYDNYFGHKNPQYYYHTQWLYSNTPVIEIAPDSVKNLYRRSEIWFVQFYGPRSSLSHQFHNEWVNVANRLSGLAKVAAVNCDENEDLCTEFNIKKYPVLILFSDSTIVDPEVYQGERSAGIMSEFVISKIKGFLRFVGSNNVDEYVQSEPNKVKLIFFSSSKDSLPLMKALSTEFKEKVIFGESRSTDTELTRKYNVNSFPTLISVTHNAFERYQGPFNRISIENWLYTLIDSHKVAVFARELNRSLYSLGNCNNLDSQFCFICFDPNDVLKGVLDSLALEFEKDPVKIFWASSKKYPNLSAAFNSDCVVYRGKKQRYFPVECGSQIDCIRESLVNALSGNGNFVRVKSTVDMTEKRQEL